MLTPLTAPQDRGENRYTDAHIKTRNTIERGFGLLKRRFTCLGKTIELINTKHIIVAAAVLHNLTISYRVVDGEDEDTNDPYNPDDPRAQEHVEGN